MPSITLFTLLSLAMLVLADEATQASNAGGRNILGYIPSKTLAIMGAGAYNVIGLLMFLRLKRFGGIWFIAVPMGAFIMTGGLGGRVLYANNPNSIVYYMAWNLPVVLSPCLFIAGVYVVLGRLAQHLHAERYIFIRPVIFIFSEIIASLAQAAGSGLTAFEDVDKQKLGANIFLGGLILQAASFALFSVLLLVFLWNVKTQAPELWNLGHRHEVPFSLDWRMLAGALVISCIGILVRSGYRILETSQGLDGELSKNERIFYMFDALPLANAIGIFVLAWPQKFFSEGPSPDSTLPKHADM